MELVFSWLSLSYNILISLSTELRSELSTKIYLDFNISLLW